MLSSELAELAGVTVRTLRHYHQIGLLAEPPRSAGGYRRYDVGHLVRLLRITRLTALGVPLSALSSVLDDPAAAEELLDDLDRQAAAGIELLTARRDSIAALRRTGSPPDMDPDLAAFRSASGPGLPAEMARYEREQLVLVEHLLGDDAGRARLRALLGAAAEESAVAGPLTARFYALDHDAPDAEVDRLIEEWVAHLRPILARLSDLPELDRRASSLLNELDARSLKPVQHRVVRRIEERLSEPGEG
ncbi:MerR family transcriptional regulator [Pseudonocardia sp. HH130630-07]|uniref:MerR family transcriptional regulator n=1 Tax=Pseudonocardia sp. HH130630-07 TaxID=1690815 RepID=UPI0008150D1F|nr:MerR family transcriptional regulator [Pseudonocardia sp. HH130630-07]ANY08856.1 MerR family transcriptional regulator [Pseudonocardia sp. HH130630-07]